MSKLLRRYESETGDVGSRICGPETSYTRSVLVYDRDYVEWLEKKLTEALIDQEHLAAIRRTSEQLKDQLIKDGLLDSA